MTNFRALCADLAAAYLRTLEHINNDTFLGYEPSDDPLLARTRALLAEPVGQGASDAEIINEATNWLSYFCAGNGYKEKWQGDSADLINFARALLTRYAPPPAPVAVGERLSDEKISAFVAETLDAFLCVCNKQRWPIFLVRSTITRYTPHPAPVAVGERLPGNGDCDDQGRCWLTTTEVDPGWVLDYPEQSTNWTHWLPHHAIPTPRPHDRP